MYAPTSIKPPVALAATPARPLRAQGTRSPGGATQAVLAVAAAALMSAWALAQWASPSSTLSQDVQAFQQHVVADTGTPSDAAATDSLARRYLPSLAPELRHRISEQVRAEQRAGLTPAGNDAFVMRRLALYEEALQQAGNAHAR
jgi:hypothetical protein